MSEGKCFEESQSFMTIYMVWRSYFFFPCTAPAALVLSGSPECPGNDHCGQYDGPRAAAEHRAAASDSCGRQAAAQPMHCGAPVLQINSNLAAK